MSPSWSRARAVTFFTRDLGFFDPNNRSRDYCIVCLAVGQHEAVSGAFARRRECRRRSARASRIVAESDSIR